uniref:Uncharacterized protein n=1 Tax=Ditylenchus dipsaci TaxID=166011 RepID=A0A915DYW5_9BILA
MFEGQKEERQLSSTTNSTIDKDRWRSSTTILDSVYKDLSKSILTIDDLSVLSSSRNNLHKSTTSESNISENRLKRNSFKEEYAFLTKQPLPASINSLNHSSPGKENQADNHPMDLGQQPNQNQKGGVRKTKLSSLKRTATPQTNPQPQGTWPGVSASTGADPVASYSGMVSHQACSKVP